MYKLNFLQMMDNKEVTFFFISEVKKTHHHHLLSTVTCIKREGHGGKIGGEVHGKIKGVEGGGLENQVTSRRMLKVYIQKTEFQHIGQDHIQVTVLVHALVILNIVIQVQDQGLGHDPDQSLHDEKMTDV